MYFMACLFYIFSFSSSHFFFFIRTVNQMGVCFLFYAAAFFFPFACRHPVFRNKATIKCRKGRKTAEQRHIQNSHLCFQKHLTCLGQSSVTYIFSRRKTYTFLKVFSKLRYTHMTKICQHRCINLFFIMLPYIHHSWIYLCKLPALRHAA